MRRLRLRAFRERARQSLLFLPLAMVAVSITIAVLLGNAEEERPLAYSGVFTFTPQVAISLLTTIAGAVITTAGVVFSLLVVSLQLASGQFSPRVLRGFWRDLRGQILIGLLMSTFVFSVFTLARIDPAQAFAPTLTIDFALLLALLSVFAIVIYLDHISRQQYVGGILGRVVAETRFLINQLPYGPHLGKRVGEPCPRPDLKALGEALAVHIHEDGWVQQLSRRALVASCPPDSVIRLCTRVGAYVTAGTPVLYVWPPPPDQEIVTKVVEAAIIVGPARTMQQDIDYGLRQLNDIALRSLSPATNDPTTAVEVVLHLGSVMRPLLIAPATPQCVCDAEGRTLITSDDLDKAEFVRHAFHELRLYATGQEEVLATIGRVLTMLREACTDADAIAEIDRLLGLVEPELTELRARSGLPPLRFAPAPER